MTGYSPMFLGDQDFREDKSGSKAANLHLLSLGGFAVPPGFVVTHGADLDQVSDDELGEWVDRLGGFPVAVRSSGAAEDLDHASFAGQYESYLGVGDLAALRDSVAKCRASAATDRLASYLGHANADPATLELAVLVQRQVDARTSGVSFTIDPVSGDENLGVVEYCDGLGDALVSGRVTANRMLIRLRDAEVVERCEPGSDMVCTSSDVVALTTLMIDVQAARHRPQDIEWSIGTDGTLWLLQARPITAITWRTDVGQYTDADFRDGGVSARVCTPMMYSLYRNAFQSTMQEFFVRLGLQPRGEEPEWIAMYYGRPYWNVAAVKRCFAKVPGWRENEFDADLGVNKDYGDAGPVCVPTTVSTVGKAIPTAFAVKRMRKRELSDASRFADRWPARYDRWRQRVGALTEIPDAVFGEQLSECLSTFHTETEQAYFRIIFNNTVLQSDFKALLERIDATVGGTTAVIDLLGGLADISHLEMQKGIRGLYTAARRHGPDSPAVDDLLTDFIDAHGFHADVELELRCPRWSEDPQRLRDMIQAMLNSGVEPIDPDAGATRQRGRYLTALAELRSRLRAEPAARLRYTRSLNRQLTSVREYLVVRERMRQFSAQCYAVVRAYVVEAGRRLVAEGELTTIDDAFMLSATELVAVLSGRRELLREIPFRKAMFEGFRDLQPPHELGSGIDTVDEDTAPGIRGLACSPGVVEGTARVCRSLGDIDSVTPGDILVTPYTDPGWTPALGLVTGVVTEVGGVLSHAAVISREYGIPAVLNVSDATTRIRSGQRIRVNGSAGTVEILGEDVPAGAVSVGGPVWGSGKRIICVTGVDGSGKSTQIAELSAAFEEAGKSVARISVWDGLADKRIRERLPFANRDAVYDYLRVLTPASRTLFLFHALQVAVDIAASKAADVLLLDGYWYKYFATEVAHDGNPSALRALAAGFPEPDVTFYLRVPVDDLLQRKGPRSDYESGYGDDQDFVEFQGRSQDVLEALATELGWLDMDATAAPEEITERILRALAEENGL